MYLLVIMIVIFGELEILIMVLQFKYIDLFFLIPTDIICRLLFQLMYYVNKFEYYILNFILFHENYNGYGTKSKHVY